MSIVIVVITEISYFFVLASDFVSRNLSYMRIFSRGIYGMRATKVEFGVKKLSTRNIYSVTHYLIFGFSLLYYNFLRSIRLVFFLISFFRALPKKDTLRSDAEHIIFIEELKS